MPGPGAWDGPSCVGGGHARSPAGLSGEGVAPGGLWGESCGARSLGSLDFSGQMGSPLGPGFAGEGGLKTARGPWCGMGAFSCCLSGV